MTQDYNTPSATADITTVEVRAGERIRWGAIVAGLFAALSTLILLSVLGVAIGLSAYDPGEQGWSVGAGIWSVISMIVAFMVGGWIAGRWGAPLGYNSPLMHGAMVWAVAIPLSLLVLGSIGTMFGSATLSGGLANRNVTSGAADQFDGARPAGAQIGDAIGRQTADTPAEEARRGAAGAAWWTLFSLLLGLGAATIGGYLGAGNIRDDNWHRGARTGSGGVTGTPTT